ncbi:histidinol dehydrogenase [Mobilicoccus massiliensis]|uniref:histidinol dehydrogenase n=1 Tax=Mobilicoccus massiliensis TaxID=1522310 RepID=UPI000693DFCC|nr:histidinol dehydrogenase [Mobilicoccus massiliensis]
MISRLDLRGSALSDLGPRGLRDVLPRAEYDVADALEAVRPICEAVRDRGATALREFGERFDGVAPTRLRVPPEVLAAALEALDPEVRAALEESIRRARLVHADQMPREHVTTVTRGGTVAQRWIPVERVGLYVPGGLAVYPSSVVMNVVPAQEAGVSALAVASPPQRDNTGVFAGYPHPTVLGACALLGVDEVYAVGGAQAVAMFAYGAREENGESVCEPVDLVTGPGNVYVASAKRLLRGVIGIDAEAGPTEIAILADDSAGPAHVAADLVSQAEHDTLAASVLVTDSEEFAARVEEALEAQVARTKHHERVLAALGGRQSAIVLVDDLDAGQRVVDAYGAEHLEIQTRDAATRARTIRNAGAIFVGSHSPVSLGDYAAGSNHVLPTSGSAAFSSGLSVYAFLRSVQVVEYDAAALAEIGPRVVALSHAEDLPGHGDAILARSESDLGAPAGASRPGAPR